MGWKNVIGKRVITGTHNGQVIFSTIVGVIRDFNTYSLQHKIAPMVLSLPDSYSDKDNLYVRLGKGNTQASLNYLQQVYSRFDNENKVDYHSWIKTLPDNISQKRSRAACC
jgi:putative ABC transport system permease protein